MSQEELKELVKQLTKLVHGDYQKLLPPPKGK